MKTICAFCKTEYSLGSVPTNPVQCAVCGHVWAVPVPRGKNYFLILMAAICALMAASVFTFVIINKYNSEKKHPLTATISSVVKTNDDSGNQHFIVNGIIKNKSKNIYGVPDLFVISHDANGNIIDRQKFFASATLLEGGSSATFSHVLSVPVNGIKNITVELKK